MNCNDLIVKNVPFPYFILEPNLKVSKKSNQVEKLFQDTNSFLDLIDIHYHHDLLAFLNNISSGEYIEVLMCEKNNTKRFYQIFKGIDDDCNFHVYCVPIKTHLLDVNEMLNSVEKRLIQFNKNINDKRIYLEKAVEDLKIAANHVDRHNNIEKLAAGIAHEIRNPLTTVKGFLQLLRPYLKEIGKVQYADIALEEINRANDIIFEFLNAAKPAHIPTFDITVNKLVKDIVMLYESEAILRDIQLVTCLTEVDIILQMDANHLKQVLINLIKNAMEAIDEGFERERIIHISTIVDHQQVGIQVSDSGCGISDDSKKVLFTPFFSTKEKGTGIGLSLCKKIIEENGGSISLESTYGKGTTFTLSFPIKNASFLSKTNIPS